MQTALTWTLKNTRWRFKKHFQQEAQSHGNNFRQKGVEKMIKLTTDDFQKVFD